MIAISGIIVLIYLLLVLFFIFGFGKVETFTTSENYIPQSFSIIVPFRNESRNLKALLTSLSAIDYPRNAFEIILVNDASEDDSKAICNDFIKGNPELRVRLLDSVRVSGSPKKDAILTAITTSGSEYILTTDADCTVPEKWLQAYAAFIGSTRAELIAGPVVLKKEKGSLNSFQELDFLSLQAVTIGAFGSERPIMCNGANLCYSKASFLKVEGFSGNDGIASGDDIFLLGKYVSENRKTAFLKSNDAIVTTMAQPGLTSLFSQRIRWAAKTSAYKDPYAKFVGAIVFLMNFLLVIELLLFAMGYDVKQFLLISFLLKFNADFVLIHKGASFFGREKSLKSYFWVSLLYPFFCTSVAIASLFSGYKWKGRSFRK